MKDIVRISVRGVVETTLFEPDILPAAGQMERMREGAEAHKARQAFGKTEIEGYAAEVPLSIDYETEQIVLRISGRADAIITGADGIIIEEIKLGVPGNELVPAHMAQCTMYGHIVAQEKGAAEMTIRVIYVSTAGEIFMTYEETQTAKVLEERFRELCLPAAIWAEKVMGRQHLRDASIETLGFPYPRLREGQKAFSTAVFSAIKNRTRLFAQAPTGIGKTMAAIYPAVHALQQGKTAAILFLTARGTGRRSALMAADVLAEAGAKLLAVEIVAKAKACPFEMQDCRPETCRFADGFYVRLRDAREEVIRSGGVWDSVSIAALAEQHMLCPFELSLDLAAFADLVICDYNYVYDPVVSIQALMSRRGGVTILVDEAHRLAERVRENYSAHLGLSDMMELRRAYGNEVGRKSAGYLAMSGLIAVMRQIRDQEETDKTALYGAAQKVLEQVVLENMERKGAASADILAAMMDYCMAEERFCERYTRLYSGSGDHFAVDLLLLDAAPEILAASKLARGTVYFSATLAPLEAQMRLLGSLPGDPALMLPSPFSPSALRVDVCPLDVRYQARERTAEELYQRLLAFTREHPGNTMIFFPSYAYMDQILEKRESEDTFAGKQLLVEKRGMTEMERTEILGRFAEAEVVLFSVLGGSFSEGIDLPGALLCNVAIVSTGLPTRDARSEAMQAYFAGLGEDGYFYTMTLPGMIRVIQAAGRLIRSETDTGHLMLIDRRYQDAGIRRLLADTLIGAAMAHAEQQ
ncbi:MAG: hypothetical protein IJ719_02450 [Clostridia bacterium]|nr:hypothetical protein [Clostridia bacterium]